MDFQQISDLYLEMLNDKELLGIDFKPFPEHPKLADAPAAILEHMDQIVSRDQFQENFQPMAKALPIVQSFEGNLPGTGSCLPWCILEDPLWDWVEILTYPTLVWSTWSLALLSPWIELAQSIQMVKMGKLMYSIDLRWEGFMNGIETIIDDSYKFVASIFIEIYNGFILLGIGIGYTAWAAWEEWLYSWSGFFWILDLGLQLSNTFILHFDHVADWFKLKQTITIPFILFWPEYFIFYYPYLLMNWWWQTDMMEFKTSLNDIINFMETEQGSSVITKHLGYMPTLTADHEPLDTGLSKSEEGNLFSRIIGDEDVRNSENNKAHLQTEDTDELMLYRAKQIPLEGRTGFACNADRNGKRPSCADGYCCGSTVNQGLGQVRETCQQLDTHMVWMVPEREWMDKIQPEAINAQVKPQYYTFRCIEGAKALASSAIAVIGVFYLTI